MVEFPDGEYIYVKEFDGSEGAPYDIFEKQIKLITIGKKYNVMKRFDPSRWKTYFSIIDGKNQNVVDILSEKELEDKFLEIRKSFVVTIEIINNIEFYLVRIRIDINDSLEIRRRLFQMKRCVESDFQINFIPKELSPTHLAVVIDVKKKITYDEK